MTLMPCPECADSVSDKASSCPHCGFPVATAVAERPPSRAFESRVLDLDACSFKEWHDWSEAEFLRARLLANGGNVKRTAESLGMQRSHLYKKIERYGLA